MKSSREYNNGNDGTSGRSTDTGEPTRTSPPVSNVSPEEEAAQVFADLEADPHFTKVDLSEYAGATRISFFPGIAGTDIDTPEHGDGD